MSTIESSVTRLLVSTKHLLESLTQWARQRADDKFVSDAYVKLGNDFRAATRAFTNVGVDISDLGDVPKALRIVLESALSEAPTQENLDRFLPNIRNIIVNLLLNLKAKQIKAKEIADENLKLTDVGSATLKVSDHSHTTDNKSDISTSLVGRKGQILLGYLTRTADDSATLERTSSNATQSNAGSSEALAKLQQGNFILRRASKRFSAYQFAKLSNINNQLTRISDDSSKLTNTSFDERSMPMVTNDLDSSNGNSYKADYMKIFMRVGEHTKKVIVLLPLTLASIRLQFVEKFAYSPGSAAFPDIYILDPQSKIWFELEDQFIERDVKQGSLLSLKEEVKEDATLAKLDSRLENFDKRLEEFASKISMEMKDLVSSMSTNISIPTADTNNDNKAQQLQNSKFFSEIMSEIKGIQAILKSKKKFVESAMEELTSVIEALKTAGWQEGDNSSNRHYMQNSYAKLSEDSDNLLTKVDDLQDVMEALRKDVAQRGVRLGPKQLRSTRKEIEDVKQLLSNLTSYIADGKSTWKKIWEAELDKVCEEQQFFNLQDDLTSDLEEDIKKIQETFDLIEKCSLEQSKQTILKKATFPGVIHLQEPGESLHNLRDAVMNQVSALIPDHQSRLEAIAKAEKLRQKEREVLTVTQFQEELGDFVEDNKFKTSGGIEELERRRQQKDSENLKLSLGII